MSAVLVSSWGFSPWRSETATSAAAYLMKRSPDALDVIRADLDAVRARERPRPAIEARIRRARSIPGYAVPPASWRSVQGYAVALADTVAAWRSAGAQWDEAYSGPGVGADHLAMALLRFGGDVPAWTAHLTGPLTHAFGGARLTAAVGPGDVLDAARRVLEMQEPEGGLVSESIAALIGARADRLVVASAELGEHVLAMPALAPYRRRLADRMEVWSRPAAGPRVPPLDHEQQFLPPASEQPPPVVVTVQVDTDRWPLLEPVLTAYQLMTRGERDRIRLRLLTCEEQQLAIRLRRSGVEGAVLIEPDTSPMTSAARAADGDLALILERPTPAGLASPPGDLPELADHAAYGTRVVVVAAQDSAWRQDGEADHLPAGHVSAALGLLRDLAASSLPARG